MADSPWEEAGRFEFAPGTADELELALRCLDLTSLEGSETPAEINGLCERAVHPFGDDPRIPSVAAVVVHPPMVPIAAEYLKGTGVRTATVVGFPIPEGPLEARLEQIRGLRAAGADEIDLVFNRALLDTGDEVGAAREIEQAKEAVGSGLFKVILETGELGTGPSIRRAAMIAMEFGADFLKSSTGKVGAGITIPAAATMLEAIRDFAAERGRRVGVKFSGGVRTVEDAVVYLRMVRSALGDQWLTPERFRIGASSLLEPLVAALRDDSE